VTLEELDAALAGYRVDEDYAAFVAKWRQWWEAEVDRIHSLRHGPPISQGEVIGAVNRLSRPEDTVVCAAGILPGDLTSLATPGRGGYHLGLRLFGHGYEIAGGWV
jgi:3D-(3,5/4)-trihydroxycyclohexane-1,2-dione acylhydrolase (decyclizing)